MREGRLFINATPIYRFLAVTTEHSIKYIALKKGCRHDKK